MGFGTWVAFGAGKVIVGLDSGDTDFDTAEETGGAKTHTLTVNQIPAHTHTIDTSDNPAGSGSLEVAGGSPIGTKSTQSTGGGQAHNNLQPYIVAYMWKRTV